MAFGGIVLATDKLNRIKSIVHENGGGYAVAEAGVILSDLQRAVDHEGLLYPPDPTERGCFIGGNVATNASGARTYKYGPTRVYIRRLKVVLASGEIVDLRRGDVRADANGRIRVGTVEVRLPNYHMPATRKNASGYFVAPEMDAVDLFIGSEGTLGVICEVETRLLPKPEGLLSGVVFFENEADVLALVADARARVDARALEFFDHESLNFLREKYPEIPEKAVGAIFFEQETRAETEDAVLNEWMALLDQHHAFTELMVCDERTGPGEIARVSTPTARIDERMVRALQPAESLDRHGRAGRSLLRTVSVIQRHPAQQRSALHNLWPHRRQPRPREHSPTRRL